MQEAYMQERVLHNPKASPKKWQTVTWNTLRKEVREGIGSGVFWAE